MLIPYIFKVRLEANFKLWYDFFNILAIVNYASSWVELKPVNELNNSKVQGFAWTAKN
jgi:hypothetical protein